MKDEILEYIDLYKSLLVATENLDDIQDKELLLIAKAGAVSLIHQFDTALSFMNVTSDDLKLVNGLFDDIRKIVKDE